jgi:hypothetical protein
MDVMGNFDPKETRFRHWVIVLADGKTFGQIDVYQAEARFRLTCSIGDSEQIPCTFKAESDGTYRTLKAALHGALLSLAPGVAAVFGSKLNSMNTGEPWTIKEPKALNVAELSFQEQTGGAFLLGQIYFDEERLELVETLITDPDTMRRCDPPVFTVHADANG